MFPGGKKNKMENFQEVSDKHLLKHMPLDYSSCFHGTHFSQNLLFVVCNRETSNKDKALANISKSKVMDSQGNACANSHLGWYVYF